MMMDGEMRCQLPTEDVSLIIGGDGVSVTGGDVDDLSLGQDASHVHGNRLVVWYEISKVVVKRGHHLLFAQLVS